MNNFEINKKKNSDPNHESNPISDFVADEDDENKCIGEMLRPYVKSVEKKCQK